MTFKSNWQFWLHPKHEWTSNGDVPRMNATGNAMFTASVSNQKSFHTTRSCMLPLATSNVCEHCTEKKVCCCTYPEARGKDGWCDLLVLRTPRGWASVRCGSSSPRRQSRQRSVSGRDRGGGWARDAGIRPCGGASVDVCVTRQPGGGGAGRRGNRI
jgi:hypothetical protein